MAAPGRGWRRPEPGFGPRATGVLLALALALLVLAGGGAVAALNLDPVAAAVAGLCVLVAIFAIRGVSSDQLAFGLTGMMVAFIPWDGIRLGGGALVDAMLIVAFAATVGLLVQERRPAPLPSWMAFAGAGLVVSALLTIAFPPSLKLQQSTVLGLIQQSAVPAIFPFRSDLSALFKFEVAWIVLPLILVVNARTRRRCTLLLDLWAAAATISAVVGVLDYAGVVHLAAIPITNERSSGLTIHPNYLAFESALALPLALLWFGRSRAWNVAGIVGTGGLLGGVYVSGSRDATIGALLALALTILLVARLRRGAGLALPAVGIAIVALLMFTQASRTIIHQVRLDPNDATALASNFERQGAADVALTQFKARPVQGVGFAVIQDAHDIYLELLAAGGVIALVAFLVYCGGLLQAARRALSGAQRPEAVAAVVSILVWLLAGTFDNQLIDKFLYVVPGLLLAMARVTLAERAADSQL